MINLSHVTGARILAVTLLSGLWAAGCSSSNTPTATGGSTGGSSSTSTTPTGGSTSATGTTGTGGNTTATATGGSTSSAATGGANNTATGGSNSTGTGGATSTAGSSSVACDTTNGSYTENTTFGTAASTAPYTVNSWTWATGAVIPTVTQTTTSPTGIDCSAGCAVLTANYADTTPAYAAGLIIEYFGSAAASVNNLLNETITVKVAVVVTLATGATTAPALALDLFGFDTTTGVNTNVWTSTLGSVTSLDASTGFHTVTHKVIDEGVPSWAVTRTLCASQLHSIGIRVQNSAAITADTAATIAIYVQSIAVAP